MSTPQIFDPASVEAAAARLEAAVRTGQPCAPVRDLLASGGVDAAYAVQDVGTRRALEAGRRLVGRKIGLTSLAVQRQLGVDQPDFGMLFDDMDQPLGAPLSVAGLHQPKVEAEIAFVLKRDLCAEWLTTADVLGAIDHAVAALEIVGSRIAGWDIGILDTVADNASSGAFVLGHRPMPLHRFDVVAAQMVMTRAGDPVSRGRGSACLGSPVSALLWLAREMVRRQRPLLAGDVVLSGALGPMVAVQPGDVFDAHIEGLGSVTAVFEA
jgi:2-keto-4-pentenoate hydratase